MNSQPLALIAASSLFCFGAVALGIQAVGPSWDALSRRYVGDIIPKLEALGLDHEAVRGYLQWWGIAMFGVLVVFGVILLMPPVALALVYLVFIAPRHLLNRQIAQRRLKIRDQLVRATTALANGSRAGLSLPQALETVAAETPQPLAGELHRIVREYQAGRPLGDAMREVKERLNLEAFTIFCSAILICMERGGRVTYALERISVGLQELQRLERKLEADTASGRKLAMILAIFPLIFLAMFTLLDPVAMSYVYNTFLGQCVLVGVGAMVFLAVRWCMRILSIDF